MGWARIGGALMLLSMGNSCGVLGQEIGTSQAGGALAAESWPTIGIAVVGDEGSIQLRRFTKRTVVQSVESAVPPEHLPRSNDGKVYQTKETKVATAVEEQTTRFGQKSFVAKRLDGSVVPWKTLAKEIKKPRPVILLNKGEVLDPEIKTMFRDGTLIFEMEPPSAVFGGGPVYAPARPKDGG